jgi:putative transposase
MLHPRRRFIPFDEKNAVRIYHRNLPHWRQDSATYFVTFRLGDSLPQSVLDQWEYEKRIWLAARGIQANPNDANWPRQIEKLPESQRRQFHKHFNRLFHAALDEGQGACYLNMLGCLAALREKLLEGDHVTYHLGDFVVMPNHVHLLFCPSPSTELERLLHGIKGFTSRLCNQLLGRSGRFWQPDSYDHIVRSLEQLAQYRQYIAENPTKAGVSLHPDAAYHASWMDAWFS